MKFGKRRDIEIQAVEARLNDFGGSYMELANLVLKLEFLCNDLVAGQIVGDNDRDAMLLDKRRQPATPEDPIH